MSRWAPPPALGLAPETVTEPVLIMHWGVTAERVKGWLEASGHDRGNILHGIAGSSGVIEGVARVIHRVEQLRELEDGEILVASCTSTSWTPVFGRISDAVTDAGGVMCHAAIVAREYGLPAVLGTGSATREIKTGDIIRVDADNGVVTILERA
jgi:pyruvate,water dikinase